VVGQDEFQEDQYFFELAKLVVAPDYQYLVVSFGTDEIGTQAADQADHDGTEHRTPEAHHLEAIHKPASQVEHARIENQQKQAEGQNGEGKGEQNQHRSYESVDEAERYRRPDQGSGGRRADAGHKVCRKPDAQPDDQCS
jgi:hypothetical protein